MVWWSADYLVEPQVCSPRTVIRRARGTSADDGGTSSWADFLDTLNVRVIFSVLVLLTLCLTILSDAFLRTVRVAKVSC